MTWATDNFGDRLNEIIWPHFAPEVCASDAPGLIVGIGSLLNHRLPQNGMKYVLGSGFGHGDEPTVDDSWRVFWVRGPETANLLKRLSGRDYKFITDGAIMLSEIYPREEKKFDVSLIPHCSACIPGAWKALSEIANSLGINLISPEQAPAEVVRQISQSRKILTEALHGAIVADSFGVPWKPLVRRGIERFKWVDWTSSMSLPYVPAEIVYNTTWFGSDPSVPVRKRLARRIAGMMSKPMLRRQLGSLASSGNWYLSDRTLMARKIAEIKEELDRFKHEIAA